MSMLGCPDREVLYAVFKTAEVGFTVLGRAESELMVFRR